MQPHASKQDWKTAVAGLHFPASRAAVVNRALDNGGLDHEVKIIVERLPDKVYQSEADLRDLIRSAYAGLGVEREALPI
jgi:hypothetical protein